MTRECPFRNRSKWWQNFGSRGNPVWYIEGKDEGHGFAKKTNRDYQEWAQQLFLERFLK